MNNLKIIFFALTIMCIPFSAFCTSICIISAGGPGGIEVECDGNTDFDIKTNAASFYLKEYYSKGYKLISQSGGNQSTKWTLIKK